MISCAESQAIIAEKQHEELVEDFVLALRVRSWLAASDYCQDFVWCHRRAIPTPALDTGAFCPRAPCQVLPRLQS